MVSPLPAATCIAALLSGHAAAQAALTAQSFLPAAQDTIFRIDLAALRTSGVWAGFEKAAIGAALGWRRSYRRCCPDDDKPALQQIATERMPAATSRPAT